MKILFVLFMATAGTALGSLIHYLLFHEWPRWV